MTVANGIYIKGLITRVYIMFYLFTHAADLTEITTCKAVINNNVYYLFALVFGEQKKYSRWSY